MSTTILRDYQINLINQIYAAWDTQQNVCVQLATGAGKTVLFSKILEVHDGHAIVVVHRCEILEQISITLAKLNIKHDIIASDKTIRRLISAHLSSFNESFYQAQSSIIVASVDTLRNKVDSRFNLVTLLIQDEGHHALKKNKWGQIAELFEKAKGLYPTATPCRADGKGLGRHADGMIDCLIVGPGVRQLINAGYLCDYIIYAPAGDLDLSQVPVVAGGDYSQKKLQQAVKKSHIVGDIVSHYVKHASGKLGLTFATGIENATDIAKAYREAGVPAEVISGKTPDAIRIDLLKRFKNREILQLVSVDIFGEGVDIPGIEVISFGRPTESYAVYMQQFGRALRPMPGKTHAIIIDHAGNVMRHKLPDTFRHWTLNRRNKKENKKEENFIKICGNESCCAVYSKLLKKCPYCGFFTEPISRESPEHVDGDLIELSQEILEKLRGEVRRIDNACIVPGHLDMIAKLSLLKKHKERQLAQKQLREEIAKWAGFEKHRNKEDSEIYKLFYLKFGIDILSAQALGRTRALELSELIKTDLGGIGCS